MPGRPVFRLVPGRMYRCKQPLAELRIGIEMLKPDQEGRGHPASSLIVLDADLAEGLGIALSHAAS